MEKLNNLYEEELVDLIGPLGMKSYRADQIFRAIHKQGVLSIDEISQLSNKDREALKTIAYIPSLSIERVFESKLDETKKLLYRLEDDYLVEGVLMKYKHGYSLCISTQVGCRMGCSFCASTINGLDRNLQTYEILNQVYKVEDYFSINISNIVLMGSGEPLDNYDNVLKALKILNDPKARNISLRNVTLSTCGLANKIVDLAYDLPQIGLAVSIHSFDDKIRESMMPINRAFDLSSLLASIRTYQGITKNRVSFEYTVNPGINDRQEDIGLIKDNLKGINYIINLIALNPIGAYNNKNKRYGKAARVFKENLDKNAINNTLRRELGRDISASCGQLKKYYEKEGVK